MGALEVTKETEKISAEKPTVGQVSRRFVPPMWLAISVIAAVLVLSGGIAWWLGHRNSEVADTSNYTCSNETIKSANSYITAYDSAKLSPLVATMAKYSGYKKDVNCLYIATRYYIMIGQGSAAQANLDVLKTLLPKSNGYSVFLNPIPMGVGGLQSAIDTLNTQAKEVQQVQENNDALDQAAQEGMSQ